MPAPTFAFAGTPQAGTGNVTVAWPSHQMDDIALLVCESANEAVVLGTPAGFVEVLNSPQGTGTAGGTSATRLTVFWCRATSGAMASPVVTDPGNHINAQIVTFRGVIRTGNPWDVTAGAVLTTASTSVTIAGPTTTLANTLCVAIVANGTDTTTAQTSAPMVNAALSGIAERADQNTTQGGGGGFGVDTGIKATAGAVGNTTCTITTSSVQGKMLIALKPEPDTVVHTAGVGVIPAAIAVALSMSLLTKAAPAMAFPVGSGQATAPIAAGAVQCAGVGVVGFPCAVIGGNIILSFATSPAVAGFAVGVGHGTVVGLVDGTGTADAFPVGQGQTRTVSHQVGQASAFPVGTGFTILETRGAGEALVFPVGNGRATAVLGFTPADGVGEAAALPVGTGQARTVLSAVGEALVFPVGKGAARTKVFGTGVGVAGPTASGVATAGGIITPPAIHYAAIALQKVSHGSLRLQSVHGSSVMDQMRADVTTLTADSEANTADAAPMGIPT